MARMERARGRQGLVAISESVFVEDGLHFRDTNELRPQFLGLLLKLLSKSVDLHSQLVPVSSQTFEFFGRRKTLRRQDPDLPPQVRGKGCARRSF